MQKKNILKAILFFSLLAIGILNAEATTSAIRLNQVGFYPNDPKFAVAVGSQSLTFYITTPNLADTVFTGSLGEEKTWFYSGEMVRLIDFTGFTTPGDYTIMVPDLGQSYAFRIADFIHRELTAAVAKAFYFQRASMELDQEHAGKWSRPAGHPDTQVYVHASAASSLRPENTIISAPKGWYDAGDYNKYVVNSGISTYTVLALFEHFADYYQYFKIGLPESSNAIPDILDEALWNLRWMLAMQDPNDGGVYHKLTNASFDGVIMPHQSLAHRYVTQKSTAAALNLAAVMAQSSRIFGKFRTQVPGLADSCLASALNAWRWARKNPGVSYDQQALNAAFDPDIHTGGYGDRNLDDEFKWAAAELYVTTGADSFLKAIDWTSGKYDVPAWPHVSSLALYTLAFHREKLHPDMAKMVQDSLLQLAQSVKSALTNSAYRVVMGADGRDFIWGSNGAAANQGIVLIQAYRLSGDGSFLDAAIQSLDYLLGRNATGYCFVTGFGTLSPMHIHHRPSEADGVIEPVPGILAGGPNQHRQDKCPGYVGTEPARSYNDSFCSYASNENAINWNAALLYLAGAIEALHSPARQPAN